MLSKELYEISQLNQRIAELREELDTLYNKRSKLIGYQRATGRETQPDFSVSVTPVDKWALQEYSALQAAWEPYGLAIPTFAKLKDRLREAYNVLGDFTRQVPIVRGKLALLLVPPAKDLEFPINQAWRSKQKFIRRADYLGGNFPTVEADKNWRLLITYPGLGGLYLGDPSLVLDEDFHVMAGYNTAGMGAIEYAALTLQSSHIIDRGSATILAKQANDTHLIPSARFSQGAYRFIYAKPDATIDNYRHRPTIEIPDRGKHLLPW